VLLFRQSQLSKAIEAVNVHRAGFEDKRNDLDSRKSGVTQKIAEAQDKLVEKQNEYRLKRNEQKELQVLFDIERVKKFGGLVEKGDQKYNPLADVSNAILELLGEQVGDAAQFKDVNGLTKKMTLRQGNEVNDEVISKYEQVVNDLSD
jgi:hypothetical protein